MRELIVKKFPMIIPPSHVF